LIPLREELLLYGLDGQLLNRAGPSEKMMKGVSVKNVGWSARDQVCPVEHASENRRAIPVRIKVVGMN